jgi:hypothetical protein
MLAPFGDEPWKVLLIDESDTMSQAAKDAWLSLLERIPKFRLIVFTTNHVEAFDLVWQSRVKMLELKPHSIHALTEVMRRAIPEGRTVPDIVLADIAAEVKGNARAALQRLESHLLITPPSDDAVTQTVAERTENVSEAQKVQILPPVRTVREENIPAGESEVRRRDGSREPVRVPDVRREGDSMTFTLRPSSTGRATFIEILFSEKPAQSVRDELTGAGFRWTPYRDGEKGLGGCWYGKEFNLPARYKEQPCPSNKSQSTSSSSVSDPKPSVPEPPPPVPVPTVRPTLKTASVAPTSCANAVPAVPFVSTPKAEPELQVQSLAEAAALFEDDEPPAPEPVPAAPVLAVKQTPRGWSIAHVASGAILVKSLNLPSAEAAEKVLQRVLPLADWTQPAAALAKVPGLKEKLKAAALGQTDDSDDETSCEWQPSKAQNDALQAITAPVTPVVAPVTPVVPAPAPDPLPPGIEIRKAKIIPQRGANGSVQWAAVPIEAPQLAAPTTDHAAKLRSLIRRT